MTKKTIIGIAIGIVALGVAITLARPQAQSGTSTQNQQQNIKSENAEKNSFDFGRISMAAGTVIKSFEIKNENRVPLTVKKMYTSCMCTIATLKTSDTQYGPFGMPGHGFIPSIDATIAPNTKGTVEVVFDPAAHGPAGVGRIERIITLETDGEPIEFFISATVTP